MTSRLALFLAVSCLCASLSVAQSDQMPHELIIYTSDGVAVDVDRPVLEDRSLSRVQTDEPWDPSFYPLGVTGYSLPTPRGVVSRVVTDGGGNVYAAGGIQRAGGVPVNHIARWDGASWHPLGTGVNGPVYDMIRQKSGDLIVAGDFSEAGGMPANGLARWDGSSWHPMDPGFDGPKRALIEALDGTLYVAGGVVALWDGTDWEMIGHLGSSSNTTTGGSADGLAIDQEGLLYVAGQFLSVNGVSYPRLAIWDGNSWTSSEPQIPFSLIAFDVAVEESDQVYQAGGIGSASSVLMRGAWGWASVGGGGLSNYASRLRFGPDGALFALGNGQIPSVPGTWSMARWDGQAWNSVGGGTNLLVSDVAFHDDDVIVGGNFSHLASFTEAQQSFEGIARWDGGQWHPLDSRAPSLRLNGSASGIAGSDGHFYVGGMFRTESGWSWFKRWSGNGWTALEYPFEGLSLRAAGPHGALYAFGGVDPVSGESVRVLRWDGQQWHRMDAGLDDSTLYRIVAAEDGAVYLVTWTSGLYPGQVWKWDGNAWQQLGESANHNVRAVAQLTDGRLVVGGNFTEIGGVSAHRLAVWDGTSWAEFAGGTTNSVHALASAPSGKLYAWGSFATTDSTFAMHVVRMEDDEWISLSSPGDGIGGEMMTFDEVGRLYISASSAEGGIATYDNGTWTRYAAGVNGPISSIAVTQDELWAVGRFSQITYDIESAGVARLPRTAVSTETSAPNSGSVGSVSSFPNPFVSSTTIRFILSEATPVTLTVYDLLGREVARLVDAEPHPAGEHEIIWRGEAASGIYLVRVESPSSTTTHRITRLR